MWRSKVVNVSRFDDHNEFELTQTQMDVIDDLIDLSNLITDWPHLTFVYTTHVHSIASGTLTKTLWDKSHTVLHVRIGYIYIYRTGPSVILGGINNETSH